MAKIPAKQKAPGFRFENLNGDTPYNRLVAWIRLRRIRAFVVYTAIILVIFFLIGYAVYNDVAEAGVDPGDVAFICPLLAVYLLPSIWMLIWIIIPYKHHQIRRLKRLGDFQQIAEELEQDLSSENGVLFRKHKVYVTRRFIADVSWHRFYLYPLEGLARCDDTTSAPLFYYNNGKCLKVETNVPFHVLKPYIYPEQGGGTKTKKTISKKMRFFTLALFTLCLAFVIFHLQDSGADVSKYLYWLFSIMFGCAIIYVAVRSLLSIRISIKSQRLLSKTQDPDEKIRIIEELYDKGRAPNKYAEYLSLLSTLHYAKGDAEKALELIRQIHTVAANEKRIVIGRGVMTADELYRLNEIVYLIALQQFAEAERLLEPYNGRRYLPDASFSILTARAQIAVSKGDSLAAREYLNHAKAQPLKSPPQVRDNASCRILLIEAECDLLEHDELSALSKLNEVITRCTYAPTVRDAEKLKNDHSAGEI
jgi:hypothetical protein